MSMVIIMTCALLKKITMRSLITRGVLTAFQERKMTLAISNQISKQISMPAKTLIIKTHITTTRIPSISILHQPYIQSTLIILYLQNSTQTSIHISNICILKINAQKLKPSTRIFAPVLRMTTVSTVARLISQPCLTSIQHKSVSV